MDYALSNFIILGLITNQPFLRDIMKNESYCKASFSTRFVDEHFSDWELESPSPEVIATALLTSKSAPEKVSTVSSRDPYSPWSSRGTWRQNI
jgi:acetyl/propionyl-CoA carboxylase alpha subunit